MASQRTLPPLQNLSMSDMPEDVLQIIAEKMVDLGNPGDVCAKWAQLCKAMKNGLPMCANPDDGAWKRGCELLGLDEKPVDGKLKDKTWREVFNALCDELHRLRRRTRDGYKWYTRLLNEKQTGARGAAWLRRCAGNVYHQLLFAPIKRGDDGMLIQGGYPGLEAIVYQFGSRPQLNDAFWKGFKRDRDLANATTVAKAQAAFDAGADVNARDDDGKTALMFASGRGNVEVVQALLAAGADVNTQNQMRMTALMVAAGGGHMRIVRDLLEADADVLLRDVTGNDAQGWALAHDHDDLWDMLREEADAARTARTARLLERHMQRVRSLLEAEAGGVRPPATNE